MAKELKDGRLQRGTNDLPSKGGIGRESFNGYGADRQYTDSTFGSSAVRTSTAGEAVKGTSSNSLLASRTGPENWAAEDCDFWADVPEVHGDDIRRKGRAEETVPDFSQHFSDCCSKRVGCLTSTSQGLSELQRKGRSKGKETPYLKFSIKPLPRNPPPSERERHEGSYFPKSLPSRVNSGHGKPKFSIKQARMGPSMEVPEVMKLKEGMIGDGTITLVHRLQRLTGEASSGKNGVPADTQCRILEPPRNEEDILDYSSDYEFEQAEGSYVEQIPCPLLSSQRKTGPFSQENSEGATGGQLGHGHLLRMPITGFQGALHRQVEKEKHDRATLQKAILNTSSFSGNRATLLDVRVLNTSLEAHITKCLCEVQHPPEAWISSAGTAPSIYVLFPTRGISDFELVPNLVVRLFPPWRELEVPSFNDSRKVVFCTTYAAVI